MELSYDELRRLYRLEKSTSKLMEVDEDFYNSLNSYLTKEKEKYLAALKKDFSESGARQFSNLKKMVEELVHLRGKKLLNKALVASRTGEVSEERMALQEKEILRSLLKVLAKHNALLGDVFSAGEKESRAKKGKDLNNLSIRIISDVPSFVGTDMNEYGPFKKGEVVSLPYKVAKLFISRELGKAEE